jgi:hypothetical protein
MTEKMKFKFPSTTDILIYAGALANLALWIKAGEMVESGGWSSVSALALGVVMSFGPVEIVKKWGGMKPTIDRTVKGEVISRANPKYWAAIIAFVVILASEALLLSPVVVAMMLGRALSAVLGQFVGPWAAGRVLVSAIALAGLSAVLGVHAPKSEEIKPEKLEKPAKSEQVQPEQAAPVVQLRPTHKMVRCTEPECGMEYAWPNGKGAHYKKHHAPIRVDPSLLINKDK